MIRVRFPRFICGCLPPEYGPSKPNCRSRWMNLRRETGGSLGMDRQAYTIKVQAADLGDIESKAQPQGYPIAQRLTEFALASRQGLMLRPHPLKTRDLTPVGVVVLDDL